MRRFVKVILFVFAVTTFITILINLFDFKDINNLMIITIALVFNFCFLMLFAVITEALVDYYKRKEIYFISGIILSILFYGYLISSFLYFYYGTFLSLNGIFYIFATRTFFGQASIALSFITASIVSGFLVYRYSKKNNDKSNISLFWVVIFVLILCSLRIAIPKEYAHEISPFIDLVKSINGGLDSGRIVEEKQGPILNFSLNLDKPNIIFITLESISADHIHYYGYNRNITPNIDALASSSIVFKNAYAFATHTDYAVPTYLSSRYTFTNELRTRFNQDYPRNFIWDILKNHGYKTGFFSAQDLEWANMINYYNATNLDFFWHSITDGKWDYGSGLAKKDFDENTTNFAIAWMNITLEPFFLYVNLQATHYPYTYPKNNSLFLPDESSSSYFSISEEDYEAEINRYDNALYYVDKQVGRILDYLKKRDILKNTIIVLTADHGESFNNSHGFIRHGYGVYEENVHIPLIFYIPGQKHFEVEEKVRRLDTIPTILNLTGFESSENFQGKVMEKGQEIFMVAQNQNYVLGLIKDDIKFILNAKTYLFEAYNLTEDPLEENNLIKNEEDEIKYFDDYGKILVSWYNCQMDYYERELWNFGELINCP